MPKNILITGATDGIGLLTAKKLLELGHHVLLHGRSQQKLERVHQTLSRIDAGNVTMVQADLSNLSEVAGLAEAILRKQLSLDVLINNAGVFKTSHPTTQYNIDVRFLVNTIAPYYLTKLLMPLLSADSRVINVSSAAQAPLDFERLFHHKHFSDAFDAYAQSKLAVVMWTRYLASHLSGEGPTMVAVNPGSLLASKMVKEGFGVAGKDLSIGAQILVKASLDFSFAESSGEYFDNDHGCIATPHEFALSTENCHKLINRMELFLATC
ncbi:SDR family NAD(P)-dependent oxidoreductase [Aliikangiella marina]|uniref:SDR family NAD(P)-dependent oxidoreductase n=2 Tax=Aliikangiella marina TaxID=1712262 RepID=A0A545TEJ0_9GAMM|nr:SDR family NAD(P)-dependent oxidoreductase [Aliikangiella marina]